MLHTFLTWPVEHLSKAPIPFVPDPFKNYFLIATALLILAIGIGLLFRSKGLWYVFIAYIVLSPIYMILGLAFDYFPVPGPKIFIVTAATIFSAIISGGLYIVTKPAFIKNS